jgi:AcrR family transcriptional regulator
MEDEHGTVSRGGWEPVGEEVGGLLGVGVSEAHFVREAGPDGAGHAAQQHEDDDEASDDAPGASGGEPSDAFEPRTHVTPFKHLFEALDSNMRLSSSARPETIAVVTPRLTPAGSTAERLRAAAEDLLLEHGHTGTSLRDITARAGANVAAVSYHFGSKDALLALVYEEVLREAAQIQRERIQAVPDAAPVEDLVRAWLAPALGAQTSAREERIWALIHRGMTEAAPGMLESLPSLAEAVETHLIARLAKHLPHLERDELLLRHNAVLAAVGVLTRSPLRGGPGSVGEASDIEAMLIAWIVGGLRAPSATGVSL